MYFAGNLRAATTMTGLAECFETLGGVPKTARVRVPLLTELDCIADAGGGEFHDVDTADQLADTLDDVSTRESRGFYPAVSLERSPSPRSANMGQPDTLYTDTLLGHEPPCYRFFIEP